jgi:ABC-type lipoprotein release transport system permease subunit
MRLDGTSGPLNPLYLLLGFALAPALSMIASWLPAVLAVRQDPAVILAEE